MKKVSEDQLIGPSAASHVLNVTTTTIRAMAQRGELPPVRTADNKTLFRVADVQRVADERAAKRV